MKSKGAEKYKNLTSTAIWWIRHQPARAGPQASIQANKWIERKRSMGSSFCHDFMDLFQNISLHAYSKMFSKDFSVWERFIWFLVHLTTFLTVTTVLAFTWEEFVARYFVTNLKDPLYPVENVKFPAVSICSNNRISRQAAEAYVKQIISRDPRNNSMEFYMEHLKLLANQYPRYQMFVADEEYVSFQSFLDSYGTDDNETFYDMRRHMTALTPKCEQIILKCWIAGQEVKCFGKNAFNTTLTMYGPCCTFSPGNSLKNIRLVGPEMGLSVALNSSQADDHANVLNINGFVVLIHDLDDYADMVTGGGQQLFVSHGVRSFLSIRPRVINANIAIRSYSARSRKCLFNDESPFGDIKFNATYTFPNCITHCRIRSIVALCRCLPFSMPINLISNREGVVYCTLSHLPCLLRYGFKWRSILTERRAIPGLEREMEDALYCPQCVPACNDVQYRISVLTLPIDPLGWKENVGINVNNSEYGLNATMLYVHFGDARVQLFQRVLSNSWVEAFSTIGNILSIFMGFSMVPVLEFLFFQIKYWIILLRRIFSSNNEEHEQEQVKASAVEPIQLFILP